jgi:hypothetical protein
MELVNIYYVCLRPDTNPQLWGQDLDTDDFEVGGDHVLCLQNLSTWKVIQ